jgi:RNA polymerase sigma-70 factor (ECF subfamily)
VEAAKRGDRAAWEAAYATYGKGLMGFLMLRLGDRDDAAEALSETFLRAIEKVGSLRGGADAFRAWLYRIARNVAVDRLRVRRRISLDGDPPELADVLASGPAERAIAAEDAAEVRAALAALDPDDREVVWLRVCAGLSSEEVGSIVGKRPGAVRMQQLRALEAMAKRLSR